MNRSDGLLARRLVLIAGVVVLGCGLLSWSIMRTSTPTRAEQRAKAMSLWESRPFSHYQLVMRAPAWCRLDIEIWDERVVTVFQNTCPNGPRTVTDLFDLIGQLDGDPETRHCAPGGCECIEVQFPQVVYDNEFGFPRTIQLRRQREPNWPLFWRYLPSRGLPLCLTPLDTEIVTVLSLKPIS